MSIFGDLDAESIPTNPFYIEKGTYDAEVIACKFQTNREAERQLYIQYKITDESSQFDGNRANRIYDLVDPKMTASDLAMLPPDDQKKIRTRLSALKRDLCGSGTNSNQRGLGVELSDLVKEDWNPEVIVGSKVVIGITNFGASNDGVNVRWVNLRDE